jgi:sugar/nucleoside kinase (ribokinase family)
MLQKSKIVTLGEILVEFVSHKKNCGLHEITNFSGPFPSGAPAIFIDQASRMGANTEIIGGIGNDGFGQCILKRFKTNNVGTTGITVNSNCPTGTAFVTYYDNGSRDFIFHLTNTAADSFSLKQALFNPSDTFLHISGSSLGNPIMRQMIMETVRNVDKAGGYISCDPNARANLMSDAAVISSLSEVIERSTCLMPSTSDLEYLFPRVSEEAAIDQLLQSKTKIIALKRGSDGSTVIGNGDRFDYEGHFVEEIDPTGAGDCFGGTFISLLSQGASLYDAGKQANAAGALSVKNRGAMEGNSSPKDIADLINKKYEQIA